MTYKIAATPIPWPIIFGEISEAHITATLQRTLAAAPVADRPHRLPKLVKSALAAVTAEDFPALAKSTTQLALRLEEKPLFAELLLEMGCMLAQNPHHLIPAVNVITAVAAHAPKPDLALQAVAALLMISTHSNLSAELRSELALSAASLIPTQRRFKEALLKETVNTCLDDNQDAPIGIRLKWWAAAKVLVRCVKIELGRDPKLNELTRHARILSQWARTGLPHLGQ